MTRGAAPNAPNAVAQWEVIGAHKEHSNDFVDHIYKAALIRKGDEESIHQAFAAIAYA